MILTSYVLNQIFNEFNKTGGFFGGVSALYGISDDIFYANGWDDPSMVNKTIVELIDEVSSKGLIIPSQIEYASNTPGYSFLIVIVSIIGLLIGRKKSNRKK